MDIKKEREVEFLNAEKDRMDSAIEYIAMMCDVELYDDEEVGEIDE